MNKKFIQYCKKMVVKLFLVNIMALSVINYARTSINQEESNIGMNATFSTLAQLDLMNNVTFAIYVLLAYYNFKQISKAVKQYKLK